MLPYIAIESIALGPLTLHIWGLMVGLGLLAGAAVAGRLARERGLNPKIVWDSLPWILLGALVAARLFHVLFYEPAYFLLHPAEVIAFWKGGLSISGGWIGAVLVGLWFLKRRHAHLLSYADVLVFGVPLGIFIGRIGCFLTHLHPGKPTAFILGVLYPDGIVRHDLGLYLSLNGLVLFLIFLVLRRTHLKKGTYIVAFLLWEGATRFFLDFYRATDGAIVDARYGGLTPAQYVSLIFFGAGIYGLWRLTRARPFTSRS